MLYAQWRFRGVDPWESWNGRRPREGEIVWTSRREALLSAFAWEAAERERDVTDVLQALRELSGNADV